ncbi:hypothetical protein PORCAN_1304 [Porphyromonas crevioricanis JCM 13913]|nr:hypothetical protein PORCAN_1304 [Porphyromonas crevioricanis JCM 13913]
MRPLLGLVMYTYGHTHSISMIRCDHAFQKKFGQKTVSTTLGRSPYNALKEKARQYKLPLSFN